MKLSGIYAPAGRPLRGYLPCATLDRCELPGELAFWALFHCRHARPPDTPCVG
ncbi:hypothetical protein SAMN04490192_3615 [Pseudomonas lundensis]|nr:hypothetical protein SAMN04490192_3615 [Pseudomonas lundensis]